MTDPTHGQGDTLRAAQIQAVRDVLGWPAEADPELERTLDTEAAGLVDAVMALAGGTPDPDQVNAVLTLVDPNGRRWLAGAFLGPLQAEDDPATTMSVTGMLDIALTLVGFKVVHRG